MRLDSALRRPRIRRQPREQLSGLDTLEVPVERRRPRWRSLVADAWPKVMALAIGLGVWQLVVLSGWKPPWLLPAPATVFGELWTQLTTGDLLAAVGRDAAPGRRSASASR